MDWVSAYMKPKADTCIKQSNIMKQQQKNTFGENKVEEFYVRHTVWSTFWKEYK